MVPEDVYELAWAGDPRISPDGSTVAFTVTRIDREANDYRSAIYLAPADRSTPPRRLTSGEKRDGSPRWSPDGHELAFASNRDGDCSQLYVLPLRGGEARRLTNTKESVREPAWSPDGTRLAFVARTRDPLYEEEDEGKRAPHRFTRLFFKFDDEGWTGDRRQQVYVVASDGSTEPVQLTEGDFESMSPTWSPDSEWIAFSSARDDDWDTRIFSDLFVVAPAGARRARSRARTGSARSPRGHPTVLCLPSSTCPGSSTTRDTRSSRSSPPRAASSGSSLPPSTGTATPTRPSASRLGTATRSCRGRGSRQQRPVPRLRGRLQLRVQGQRFLS